MTREIFFIRYAFSPSCKQNTRSAKRRPAYGKPGGACLLFYI